MVKDSSAHLIARAAVPLEICTGVPPAKSRPPCTDDHPFEFQVQQAIGSVKIPCCKRKRIGMGRMERTVTGDAIKLGETGKIAA